MTENQPWNRDRAIREFVRLERMLREFVGSLVAHAQDAEDVFQEAAVVILRKGADVEEPARFPQWCRSVARNEARNYWRRRDRQKLELWEDFSRVVDQVYAEADSNLNEDERRRRLLDQCVRQLPGPSRRILKLFYVEGLDTNTLAKRLKRSGGAVRVALTRVRETVRQCVERTLNAGEGAHAQHD